MRSAAKEKAPHGHAGPSRGYRLRWLPASSFSARFPLHVNANAVAHHSCAVLTSACVSAHGVA